MTSSESNPWGKPKLKPQNLKPAKNVTTPANQPFGQTKEPKVLDLTPDPNTAQLPLHQNLWQQTIGWQPTEEQQALFQQLYDQILVGNRQLNLTRITNPDEFWEKHLWDSLSGLAPWLAADEEEGDEEKEGDKDNALGEDEASETDEPEGPVRIIDIGTGAGFPGIPAAIALAPHMPVDLTLVDSTRKKVQFLQMVSRQLQIKATCIAERAETLGQQRAHREQYDLALIRAVGPANTCAEYAMPFLKVGGQLVLFRGQWTTQDTESLLPVIDLLGGEITDLQSWETPLTQSDRNCIFIYKDAPTPSDFPRAVGVPSKKPLT